MDSSEKKLKFARFARIIIKLRRASEVHCNRKVLNKTIKNHFSENEIPPFRKEIFSTTTVILKRDSPKMHTQGLQFSILLGRNRHIQAQDALSAKISDCQKWFYNHLDTFIKLGH